MKLGAWVMWFSAAAALISLYLQMINTIYEAYYESKKQAFDKQQKIKGIFLRKMRDKRLWFAIKIFDTAVNFHYLNLGLNRGQGHILSLPSPILFFVEYFYYK
jgi:hypothetical protein